MLKILIGILTGSGLFFILADLYGIPYLKTSQAVANLAKKQKNRTSFLEVWLGSLAEALAKRLRLNEFKRLQLEADLLTAQIDQTPEQFTANAIVKAALAGVFAVPMFFVFPVFAPAVLLAAVFLYFRERNSVSKRIRAKRAKIEYELPRLVFTVEKTLKHNRDVLYMLDSYRSSAGPELKQELDITVADMKSGNYEGAITRMESRIGSSAVSDVCRGLIGILRGDETELYWAALGLKLSDTQRQQLRLEAQKVPKKVDRLSLCLLVCFLLTYLVVILDQIVRSLGVLFG